MADIYINYTGVKGSIDEIKDSYKKMYQYSEDINDISKKLKGCIDGSVIGTLNIAVDNNKNIARNLEQLKEVLEDILKNYKETENRISKVDIEREKISDPSKTDTVGEQIWDYILEALLQAVGGDITDANNVLGILLSVGVGCIPVVGQVADLRDVIANIVKLCTDGAESDEWIALGFSLVGFIPGLGDLLKNGDEVVQGASKLLKNVDNIDEIADAVKGTMKKGSDVYQELAEKVQKVIDSDELTKAYSDLRKKFTELGSEGAKKLADAKDFTDNVDKALKAAGKYVDKLTDKLIGMFEKEVVTEIVNEDIGEVSGGTMSNSQFLVPAY